MSWYLRFKDVVRRALGTPPAAPVPGLRGRGRVVVVAAADPRRAETASRRRLDRRQLPRAQRGQLLRPGPEVRPVRRPRRGQRRDGDVDPRSDQPVPRRRRHGGAAGGRAGEPDGHPDHPQGAEPAPPAGRVRREGDPEGDPRGGGRGQPRDPRPLRDGERVLQHGDDRRPGPLPQRPGLRRGDRRLAGLSAPPGPPRAVDRGPLAGRCAGEGRDDHPGRGAEPQVQECPVPLPREQGRAGRPRGGPRAWTSSPGTGS